MADHFRPFLTSLWSAAAFFQQIVINCYRFYSLEMLLMGKGEYDRHVFSLKPLTMSYCTISFGVSTLDSRIPKLHSLLTCSWLQFNDKGENLSTPKFFSHEWSTGYFFEIDCAIFYTNLHELFCQFISWTIWVNSGKFMDKNMFNRKLGKCPSYNSCHHFFKNSFRSCWVSQ